jgi:hypothetical protein
MQEHEKQDIYTATMHERAQKEREARLSQDGCEAAEPVPSMSSSARRDGRVGPQSFNLATQAFRGRHMDPDLAFEFAQILERELRKPWLGNATTGELLAELASRSNLSYRTAD